MGRDPRRHARAVDRVDANEQRGPLRAVRALQIAARAPTDLKGRQTEFQRDRRMTRLLRFESLGRCGLDDRAGTRAESAEVMSAAASANAVRVQCPNDLVA